LVASEALSAIAQAARMKGAARAVVPSELAVGDVTALWQHAIGRMANRATARGRPRLGSGGMRGGGFREGTPRSDVRLNHDVALLRVRVTAKGSQGSKDADSGSCQGPADIGDLRFPRQKTTCPSTSSHNNFSLIDGIGVYK
jgi:hypothetical protein